MLSKLQNTVIKTSRIIVILFKSYYQGITLYKLTILKIGICLTSRENWQTMVLYCILCKTTECWLLEKVCLFGKQVKAGIQTRSQFGANDIDKQYRKLLHKT